MKNDWGEFMTLWMNGDPWKSSSGFRYDNQITD